MIPKATSFAPPLQQVDRTYVVSGGRKLIYFGGCDYFRLSSHREVLAAIHEGLERFGLNVAASRFTTGNHELYERLESELQRFFGAESATLVSNGYATNLVVAQTLAGEFSHALIDSRAHQSLRDCLPFLKSRVVEFRHAELAEVSKAIQKLNKGSRIILLTDGMFSHNGTLAPLREYLNVLPRGSKMVVDDAHGAGTIGRRGRGTCEVLGIESEQIIQTISLSKAFGTYGGAILGSKALREKMLERSSVLRGNTPLPLPLANAALRALTLMGEQSALRRRLVKNTALVKSLLQRTAPNKVENDTPIVSVFPKSRSEARQLRQELLAKKIYPSQISYGDDQAYFRFAISSEHTRAQLESLVSLLRGFSG